MSKTRVKNSKSNKNTVNNCILRQIRNTLARNKIGATLVLRGKITPAELKNALQIQKSSHKPLGQIFIEQSRISKQQLARLLVRQKMINFAATIMIFFASLTLISSHSQATEIKDVPARIALASTANAAFGNINHHPKLFGAKEKRSANLDAFTKWTSMFERFDASLKKRSSKQIIKSLRSELKQYKSNSIYDMAKNVNTMMNKEKYINDNKNWGKSDYWSTPIEFMARGGDCEDFAIAKYAALRMLGVPENRLRVAIVQDQKKNMPHAVLVVYSERGVIILDNQIKTIRSAKSIKHYKPIFSINREAWWLHTTPDKPTTIVASAAR